MQTALLGCSAFSTFPMKSSKGELRYLKEMSLSWVGIECLRLRQPCIQWPEDIVFCCVVPPMSSSNTTGV